MELRGRGSTRLTTGADAVEVMNLAVRCDSHAPRLARNAFDLVEGIDGVRDDVRLVVSELVSNAVKHSGCAADDLIQVHASRRDGILTLSVTDRGVSGDMTSIRLQGAEGRGGRGLPIVQALTSRWGTERTPGKCFLVWAELPLGPAGGGHRTEASDR